MAYLLNRNPLSNGDICVVQAPTCPLCGAVGNRLYDDMTDWLWGVPGEWGLLQCGCGLAWLNPQPCAQDIPKLYARYYTHGEEPAPRRLGRIRHEVMKQVLARMGYPVKPSSSWPAKLLSIFPSMARSRALEIYTLSASEIGRLLDVGSGNGQFIRRMRSLGWDASGVDPDRAAVDYCLTQGLNVFHGTITDVPPEPRYDVITVNHVIEHVPDPVSLLLECKRRLTPRTGRLMIMTPNLNSLGHRWFGRYWRGLETPRHLMLYSLPSLRKCASLAGLRVSALRTETRLARMIYNPSASAKKGETRVGEKNNFRTTTKIAAYLFQAIEELSLPFTKDAGEELFCVCSTD